MVISRAGFLVLSGILKHTNIGFKGNSKGDEMLTPNGHFLEVQKSNGTMGMRGLTTREQ
jgi:hypothetical protein